MPVTEHRYLCDRDTHYLLALATLGSVTDIEMILIAKVSKEGDIDVISQVFSCTNLANVNESLTN